MGQRAGAERKFASLLLFYLLEAVVHHRAESLRHHQADPDGQQQGRDDPDRGDNARFAGHVGDATSPTSFENEWTSRSQAWVMLGEKVHWPRSSHVFVGG